MLCFKRITKLFILFFIVIYGIAFHNNSYTTLAMSTSDVRFKKITTDNGLSHSIINVIFEDSKGYIWIATPAGLNKYNGTSIEVYKNIIGDKESLSGIYISYVTEDKNNNLWVGTSNGLNILNRDTGKATRIPIDKNSPNGISHNNIWHIFEDSKDNIWISTQDGLNKYNSDSKTFDKFYHNINDENSLSNNFITYVNEDSYGYIWIGTKDGLNIFDEENNIFYRCKLIDDVNTPLEVTCIEEDSEGFMWISTSEGTFKIEYTNQKIEKFDLQNNSTVNYSCMLDNDGNIWLTSNNGLVKYIPKEDKRIFYNSNNINLDSLLNNNITSITQDRSGLLWIGTEYGINILNPSQNFNVYNSLPNSNSNGISEDSVTAICEDKNGYLWVGTKNNGLNKIDRATNEVTTFYHDENNEDSINSNIIKSIYPSNDGNLLVGTSKGLNKLLIDSDKFYKYNFDNGGNNYDKGIRTVFEDSEGIIWIGTRNEFQSFNPHTKEFIIHNEKFTKNNINDAYIISIAQDITDPNILWLGSGINSGLIKFHKEDGILKSFTNDSNNINSLSFNVVRSIVQDNNATVWIGTNNGLNKFDPIKETFTVYTEKDGLCNNYIAGILVDNSGMLWISTNDGLSKFDPDSGYFTTFTKYDGLQGDQFTSFTQFKSTNNELFFGGIDGLISFYPKDIKKVYYNTKTVISDIRVHNKKIEFKDTNIKLKYKDNSISFSYFLPDYRYSHNVTYEYMLKGVDNDWIFADYRTYANYTLLSPGTYEFLVRARNGSYNISEITSIKVTILPPPWKTKGAYLVYILIIAIIIYIIFNYIKLLEKMVDVRTKQLNNKLIENKELYDKVLFHEKFKNNYFVNLSHELRTPLNVIISTVQLIGITNKDNLSTSKVDLNKYIDIIRRNSTTLLKVINDLIDSSKIEAGSYKLNIKPIDIVYLVEETSLSMKDYIERLGIELIIDPEIEEKIIYVDSTEIERCIINLLSNATKFTPKNGRILVKIEECGEDYISIIIEDTGVGIAKEHQDIIFDRFSQVESTIPPKEASSGIGLTLVKNIITLHKGTITLDSELNKGSKFTIMLPTNVN